MGMRSTFVQNIQPLLDAQQIEVVKATNAMKRKSITTQQPTVTVVEN